MKDEMKKVDWRKVATVAVAVVGAVLQATAAKN